MCEQINWCVFLAQMGSQCSGRHDPFPAGGEGGGGCPCQRSCRADYFIRKGTGNDRLVIVGDRYSVRSFSDY